jgi:hypothetical protein
MGHRRIELEVAGTTTSTKSRFSVEWALFWTSYSSPTTTPESRYQACHDLSSALGHIHWDLYKTTSNSQSGYYTTHYWIQHPGRFDPIWFCSSPVLSSQQDEDGLYEIKECIGIPRYLWPQKLTNINPSTMNDAMCLALRCWPRKFWPWTNPLRDIQIDDMKIMVWQDPFGRPELTRLWHHGKLQSLIDKVWSSSWYDRPTDRPCESFRPPFDKNWLEFISMMRPDIVKVEVVLGGINDDQPLCFH